MWQAMLMAADLPGSKQVFIDGFIGVDGQKMSKSLGNVISPKEMVDKFGVDATRYLLLTKGKFGEDSDMSWEKMITKYNADLANGLGNLVSRIVVLSKDLDFEIKTPKEIFKVRIKKMMEGMEAEKVLEEIWKIVDKNNKFIEDTKPWELIKTDEKKFKKTMKSLLQDGMLIAKMIEPFLPETSDKVKKALEVKEKVILFEKIR
jgi:methionyl-tRNA synthetase